jgi:glycosyltransferase involved in cell wall biosynthesis
MITVITATFNAAKHLPRLAQSLRKQSCKNFNWIIADGGSTDDTLSIIKENDDIVSTVIFGPDFGIYDALNKAILKVNTEYYLVLGADDVLHTTAIEFYLKSIKQSGADIITAQVATSKNVKLLPGRGKSWRYGHLAYVSQHAVGSLIKKALHEHVGQYSRLYPIAADRHFLLKAIKLHNCTLYSANFEAGIYSYEGVSTTRYYETLLDIFKVDYALSKNPRFTSVIIILKYVANLHRF